MNRRAITSVLVLAAAGIGLAADAQPAGPTGGGGDPSPPWAETGPPSAPIPAPAPAPSAPAPERAPEPDAQPEGDPSPGADADTPPFATDMTQAVGPSEERYVDSVTRNGPMTAPRRSRKALSDAGGGASVEWVAPPAGQAAAQALVERAQRRERTMDPVKRGELTRLSRVLGALHALRVSCSGREDQTYRSRMATMLDLEAPAGGASRDPLVDGFNAGFQSEGRGANPCPDDSRLREARLATHGRGLALALAVRHRPAPPGPATGTNAPTTNGAAAPAPVTGGAGARIEQSTVD